MIVTSRSAWLHRSFRAREILFFDAKGDHFVVHLEQFAVFAL
jgi:hypothetical protein